MINYVIKALLILLIFILFRRYFTVILKKQNDKKHSEIRKKILCIIGILAGIGSVFFFALWETFFLTIISLVIFIFFKPIENLYKKMVSQYNGKRKWIGTVILSCFAVWLGLALFYRTDLGMPIGVKNYLYHKYWEEFDVSGFFGATIAGHPTNQLTCCPQNGNPLTDSFNVVRKNTLSVGSRLFASDNYYGVWIREDYEKYISTFIDDYFDDFTVRVYFDSSGLGNVKYMSDEFDKTTSLMEFLSFQKNERKSEGCNFARLNIWLNNQPTNEEKELIEKKTFDLFNDLCSEYSYLRIYVKVPEYSSECITVLITAESQLRGYRISDNFFKNVEEK